MPKLMISTAPRKGAIFRIFRTKKDVCRDMGMARCRFARFLWMLVLTIALLFALKLLSRDPAPETVKAVRPSGGRDHEPPFSVGRSRSTGAEERPALAQCLQQKELKQFFRLDNWPETYLVFYGKPIMQVVKSIASVRGWKVKLIQDSPAGLKELESLISSDRLLIIFTISRAYRHSLIQTLANSTNVLISSIRNAYGVTGAKSTQLNVFRNHFKSSGCLLEDANIMPKSFLLDDPIQCIEFFEYGNAHPKSWWILKPSKGYGGEGITIHSNLTTFYKEYATCSKHTDSIIQEYIPNLLLINKRKFDIRALILIAGTIPYLLFYHEGYLRVSIKEFAFNGKREVHLTNSHVQTNVEGFQLSSHFWSFRQLQEYLDQYHPNNRLQFTLKSACPSCRRPSLSKHSTSL